MPAPDNGTRRRIDVPGADWYWEQDDQLRLTYLSSRTSEKTALDLALDLSPYLGHKRCDQRALNLAPEDWDRHRGQLERREPFRDFELQVAADDGRTVWLSLSGEPVFDAGGAFRGYLGAGRDITAQKRAQQLLLLENAVMSCLAGTGGIPAGAGGQRRGRLSPGRPAWGRPPARRRTGWAPRGPRLGGLGRRGGGERENGGPAARPPPPAIFPRAWTGEPDPTLCFTRL